MERGEQWNVSEEGVCACVLLTQIRSLVSGNQISEYMCLEPPVIEHYINTERGCVCLLSSSVLSDDHTSLCVVIPSFPHSLHTDSVVVQNKLHHHLACVCGMLDLHADGACCRVGACVLITGAPGTSLTINPSAEQHFHHWPHGQQQQWCT